MIPSREKRPASQVTAPEGARRERFAIFTGEDGNAYFHVRANGEVLLVSDGYTTKARAERGIASYARDARREPKGGDPRGGRRRRTAIGK